MWKGDRGQQAHRKWFLAHDAWESGEACCWLLPALLCTALHIAGLLSCSNREVCGLHELGCPTTHIHVSEYDWI